MRAEPIPGPSEPARGRGAPHMQNANVVQQIPPMARRSASRIASLAQAAPVIAPNLPVRSVGDMLKGRSPLSAVVVATDRHPVGLVMHYHLEHELSTEFGRALFLRQPISSIMDATPLIVDQSLLLDEVANQAMARGDSHRYDDIIVTDAGLLLGTVSIERLLGAMSRIEGVLQLAGGVAHELNQPLQIILGYCELLVDRMTADPDLHKAAHNIVESVDDMTRITRRLQALTTVETVPYVGTTTVVDLSEASESGA